MAEQQKDAAEIVMELGAERIREMIIGFGGKLGRGRAFGEALVKLGRALAPEAPAKERRKLAREVERIADTTLSVGW